MQIIKNIRWLTLVGLAFLLIACDSKTEVKLQGSTMGTTYHISLWSNEKITLDADQIQQGVAKVLQQVNREMSTYIPDSELSIINSKLTANEKFKLSENLAKVLLESKRLNALTEGALDVTVGPLVNLWGFGPTGIVLKAPSEQQIKHSLAIIGINKFKLEKDLNSYYIIKSSPDLYIDLSSIAKGFGVDAVASYLDSIDIPNYLVEIGGEVKTKGKNSRSKLWQVAIEKPHTGLDNEVKKIVGLDNLAMATSGDYRNYFEQDGKRYSHEIDPKTGYPITHNLVSVSVISKDTMTADGLATGLLVLGADKALEIANKNNIAVYLIIKTSDGFTDKMSKEFAKIIQQHK